MDKQWWEPELECVCLKGMMLRNPYGDLSVWHTHTSCVNTIGSGRKSCVIWMVLFLASLEGIRRLTSCSVRRWHLSILIRDVTQSDRHTQKLLIIWKGSGEVETSQKRHGHYVCVYVCTRPSRPRGTRRDRVVVYCLTGEYRELAESSRRHENRVSHTHFHGPSTPSGAFLQISDILYL